MSETYSLLLFSTFVLKEEFNTTSHQDFLLPEKLQDPYRNIGNFCGGNIQYLRAFFIFISEDLQPKKPLL